jgi:hypothetical protein
MARSTWLHMLIAAAVAVAALLLVRLHNASGTPLAPEDKISKTTPCKVGFTSAAMVRGSA